MVEGGCHHGFLPVDAMVSLLFLKNSMKAESVFPPNSAILSGGSDGKK